MTFIKRVVNADPGNSDTIGGDDWDTLDKYFDDIDITPKNARVNTLTTFRSAKLAGVNMDLTVGVAPADPAAGVLRFYSVTVDSNNHTFAFKAKTAGTIQEVRI